MWLENGSKQMGADEVLRQRVTSFLLSAKFTLQQDSRKKTTFTFVTGRRINVETLAALEIKTVEVKDIILALTPLDYVRGPFKDRGIEGELWEFGTTVKGKEVYIKLKLSDGKWLQNVRVLSFHFPIKQIIYAFEEERKKGEESYGTELPDMRKISRAGVRKSGAGGDHKKRTG